MRAVTEKEMYVRQSILCTEVRGGDFFCSSGTNFELVDDVSFNGTVTYIHAGTTKHIFRQPELVEVMMAITD